ncbi:DNA polymerase III subunit epsilon [Rickettsiales bacterium LUAb2]
MRNRKIVLDTETTGLNYLLNDRIVEIAAVEIIDDQELGKEFHYYINPEREIPEESTRIHGISNDDVKDKPIFASIADEFEEFIADSIIIAHNAEFDRNFINLELGRLNKQILAKNRYIDTLQIAREQFKGEKVSLDNLCDKFSIDKSSRDKFHGALIDVKLLAKVYNKLLSISKNQNGLLINDNSLIMNKDNNKVNFKKQDFLYRDFKLADEIYTQHQQFLATKIKNPIWNK